MPTPAYIDTALYLPLGGVNGFEVNGFPVNGVGIVDSPFAGVEFQLDPYRSILPLDRQDVDLVAVYPSLLFPEYNLSVQGSEVRQASVWSDESVVQVDAERLSSSVEATFESLELPVESVSYVAAEYRTSYVLATHPSSKGADRASSDVAAIPDSQEPSEYDVSTVPQEDRTSVVRRI